MRSNRWFRAYQASVQMVVLGSLLAGCTEMQQIAGEAARLSGQPGLATSLQKGGTMAQQAGSALLPIGEEEERSIGASLALQVVTRYGGIYERPELTRYVNLVGQGVALTCNRANLDYHFAILNHDSINAFATPAGYVFITKGLLQHLQNEAELATVLGHEIAHISEKHLLSILQREKQIAGITEAGLTYVNQNPALFKGLIDTVAKKLLDEGLDQGKELEADRLGVGFAARVGYEPTAYRTLLQRLRAIRGDDRAFFKTHPNFSTRLTEVDGVLGAQHLKSTGVLLPERFLSNLEGRL
jgi:beta-barrel assembly-enhancing protease